MIEIKKWTEQFLAALEETFGGRIWFFGLQGSYGRGEATEDSDIDLVVILDELSPADIQAYSRMLERFAERPFLCGFLAGKEELLSWDAADLFQFYYDTQPIKGSLEQLLCRIDPEAANRAVQTVGRSDRQRGLFPAGAARRGKRFHRLAICFRRPA